jgi:predicted aspartyl protease
MLLPAKFDPDDSLIIVDGRAFGPTNRSTMVRLAVDTAASLTTLRPHVARALGYGPSDGAPMTIRSALGIERGYKTKIEAMTALSLTLRGVMVQFVELGGHDLDGLLGLSFLYQLDYEIRSKAGLIFARLAT